MQKFKLSLFHDISKAKGSTQKEKESSKCPIYLRIYIDGKRTFKATGHEVEFKYWDSVKELVKPNCRNAHHINADILTKRDTIYNDLVKQQMNGKRISVSSARQSLAPESSTNIFQFVEKWIIELISLKKRKQGTLDNYEKHLRKLEEYHGSRNLDFEDMTAEYLSQYEQHLKSEISDNYAHALIKTLRAFFNAARKKKLITVYPFLGEGYEFPKYTSPQKDYLTKEDLEKWEENLPKLKGTVLYQAAVYFYWACYCGLRISDWPLFNKSNIYNGRVTLTVTKGVEKIISMPMNPPLQRACDLVLGLVLTDREAKINEKLKTIATKLKIGKHLTAHTARHTFAVTICLSNKVSSETASELMGITLKTFVGNYSQVTAEKIDRETLSAWANLK